jgi:hypothetical protein
LLRGGANPNCHYNGCSPLRDVLYWHTIQQKVYVLQKAAMLVGAGADVAGEDAPGELEKPFRQICDLRTLSALYSVGRPKRGSSPAVQFVTRDGDLAVAHRVREFLADRNLLSQP